MAVFKCKMCGGELELQKGMNIAECPYCGTKQTVPTLDEKLVRLYNRANQYRLDNEFDKAYGAYEAIVSEKNDEAEAYWGMLLSEFGVEYVEDPKSGKRIPTCHRTLVKSISVNENFKMALNFADLERKMFYEDEAEIIDSLQKKILNASAKEDPYDVFICYKETDLDGNRTEDSVLAQEIYDDLTKKGYKVFFSRITLEDKLGKDYEPCIFAALTSAKVMLVVTTDSDHCNAVWVKNEWKRYIEFMKTDKEKTLIPVYKNMSPYALPDEFAKLQAQDMSKIGAIQDLVRGVEKLIGKGNNSKTSLSESEQKLLNAFEKSQARKKDFLKLFISMAIGAVLMAIICGLTYIIAGEHFNDLINIPLFKGKDNSRTFKYDDCLLAFVFGGTTYLATLVSMIFLRKQPFKYSKFIFTFLFICFSGWLMFAAYMDHSATPLMWLGYAIVGLSSVLSTIIDAVAHKKLPLLIIAILLALGITLSFTKDVPQRSNERDTSVEQVIVTNSFINIRSGPSKHSNERGVVNKDEIYTILDSEFNGRTKWLKIKTGYGVEGYIAFGEGDVSYCEYLPMDKDLQSAVDAEREKESAEFKESVEAIDALNGVWKYQEYGKDRYMRIDDGMLYYGIDLDNADYWEDSYYIDYDIETKTYSLSRYDIVYGTTVGTLKYDGSKIKIDDIDGNYPYLFEGNITRYN